MRAENPIRGILGPVGSGKSSGCVLEIGRRAAAMPPGRRSRRRQSRWCVVRGTYRQLEDTTKKTWLHWFPEKILGHFHKNDMAHRINVGDMELEVLFRAADSPDVIDQFKSMDLTGVWLNEAVELPLEIMEILETRVGRFPPRTEVKDFWHGLIMDTNPPDSDHWWHWLAEDLQPVLARLRAQSWDSYFDALRAIPRSFATSQRRREKEGLQAAIGSLLRACETEEDAKEEFLRFTGKYAFWRQPSGLSAEAENLENLPGGRTYYRNMVIGKTREWIKVFVEGEYGTVTTGRPIYTAYSDDVHYNADIDDPIPSLRILVGWDFGRACAIVLSQVDQQGYWRVFDEIPETDMNVDQFGDYVKKYLVSEYAGFRFTHYCDPSGFDKNQFTDRTSAEILAAKGFDLEGGIQNFRIRQACVTRALMGMIDGKPEFQIGRRCSMIRKGFNGAYCFRRMNVPGERYADEPDKGPTSHVLNCLEYTATMLYRDVVTGMQSPDDLHDDNYSYIEDSIETSGRSAVTGY